jgi:DNA polymerase-3 subunit alpha
MTALLSVERNNTDKVALYLADARRMGITVVPPFINKAELDFSIEGSQEKPIIRYGLGAIKNAGTGAIELLLQEREENGPFENLAEMCERVDLRRVGKRALESMIKVGVFDDWGSRLQLLDALERMMSHSGKTHEAAAVGQMSLFGAALAGGMDIRVELLHDQSQIEEVDHRIVLGWEKELIGVYISEHPLTRYMELLQSISSVSTSELDETTNGRSVTIVGLVSYLRSHVTKKGEAMAFGGLEDLQGTVELIFFPRTWKTYRAEIEVDQVYLVRGKVQVENGDQAKIFVDSITNNLTINQSADAAHTFSIPDANGVYEMLENGETFEVDEPEPIYHSQIKIIEPPPNPGPLLPAATNSVVMMNDTAEITSEPGSPPPPPNFEMEDEQWYSRTHPAAPKVLSPSNGHSPAAGPEPKTEQMNGHPAPLKERQIARNPERMVIVEVQPIGNWQKTCRELVSVAAHYPGRDSLRLKLAGHSLTMDFPNQNTHYCSELVIDLEKWPVTVQIETV